MKVQLKEKAQRKWCRIRPIIRVLKNNLVKNMAPLIQYPLASKISPQIHLQIGM